MSHPILMNSVQENTQNRFAWQGSSYGLLDGTHSFCFEASNVTPGGTTFVQSEEFSGFLAFLLDPRRMFGKQTMENFERVNVDLKRRCEEQK